MYFNYPISYDIKKEIFETFKAFLVVFLVKKHIGKNSATNEKFIFDSMSKRLKKATRKHVLKQC